MSITLYDVEEAFRRTLKKKATPHRTPDFKNLHKAVGGEAEVKGVRWFIEEHNTGYDGLLERWEFLAVGKGGEKVSFWADILPGLLIAVKAPLIAHEGGRA